VFDIVVAVVFKVFFVRKCIKIIFYYYYYLKFIFKINISKQFKNIYKKFKIKKINF
jgi:hypothetical protein